MRSDLRIVSRINLGIEDRIRYRIKNRIRDRFEGRIEEHKLARIAHSSVIKAVSFPKGNMHFSTCWPGKTIENFKPFCLRNYVGGTNEHAEFGQDRFTGGSAT